MFVSRSGSFCFLANTACAALLATIAVTANAQIAIRARPADSFVDSMGVNVHMEYLHTPYRHYRAINRDLQSLGMRHFRDEINDSDPKFVRELEQIGASGYKLCGVIAGGNDYPPPGTRLKASAVVRLIHNLEPTIEAVEGPNEPDNTSFRYDGVRYPWGAIRESKDLWNIVKGNQETRDLPVLVMSEGNAPDFLKLAKITPPPIDYATYGNMHAYQGGHVGDNGLGDWYIPYSQDLTGSDALWTTEMGYHNNTRYLKDGQQQGVSQRASAIYLPIAFFSGFNRGALRTFSYELIDESKNDPSTSEGYFGLLNYDGTPKPAFTALKNLIALLNDPGHKFTPGSLVVTFSDAPGSMRFALLQKASGRYFLALWNDVTVYRVATRKRAGKDLYPQPVPITLTFDSPHEFEVYAPNDSVNATEDYTISTTSHSIKLKLLPKVLLVEISS